MTITLQRCSWVSTDPIYQHYHDVEWGRPQFDERQLFEQLCLEGQQAGLSWITILKKRPHYRHHFFNYPIHTIAQFSDAKLQKKCQDPNLIRHFAKLKSIRDNAKAWIAMQQQGINMVHWLWQFVDDQPIFANRSPLQSAPNTSAISQKMAKQLKKHGFKFVGSTTCYAFMQAVGMINDHETTCHCHTTVSNGEDVHPLPTIPQHTPPHPT